MEDRYFKAKRLDNGEWVQGFYLYDYGRNIHYIFANEIVCPNCINDCRKEFSLQDYEVDPSTICQCTGLKDKNGKLIWENDVVKGKYWEYGHSHRHIGAVKYISSEFKVVGVKQYRGYNAELTGVFEVIGNTFDNPELLEV